MKVILSRKGFDSEYGGGPSPILPDGELLRSRYQATRILDIANSLEKMALS